MAPKYTLFPSIDLSSKGGKKGGGEIALGVKGEGGGRRGRSESLRSEFLASPLALAQRRTMLHRS